MQKEYNSLNEKSVKLQHDLEEQIHTNTQLLAENSQKQILLKLKEDEINSIKVRAATSKADSAQQQDWILKCLQGGRAFLALLATETRACKSLSRLSRPCLRSAGRWAAAQRLHLAACELPRVLLVWRLARGGGGVVVLTRGV